MLGAEGPIQGSKILAPKIGGARGGARDSGSQDRGAGSGAHGGDSCVNARGGGVCRRFGGGARGSAFFL